MHVLEEVLPAGVAALFHKALYFLGTSASSDQQGVGHIDDDQIIDTQTGDQTTRPWHNDTTGHLFSENYT
jgi:hypothetical protein